MQWHLEFSLDHSKLNPLLAGLTTLEKLNVGWCIGVWNSDVKHLASTKSSRIFVWYKCSCVSFGRCCKCSLSVCVDECAGLVNLEELQISRSKVGDPGIAALTGEYLCQQLLERISRFWRDSEVVHVNQAGC
jgi:hypothetical protein